MSYFAKSKNVKELKPSDFSSVKVSHLKSKDCCAVLYYAPWCQYCKRVKDNWEKLGKNALFMNIYAMNCEKHSEHLLKIKEELPELIRGFPTIIFYRNGVPIQQQPADDSARTYPNLLKACMEFCNDS